jgi:hypothetical protein
VPAVARTHRRVSCRLAVLTAVGTLFAVGAAPCVFAQPDPDPDAASVANAAPPPPDGSVPSEEPGIVETPDGWELTVAGKDEYQVAVAPLTTALSSREYVVAGTFTGSVKGSGTTELDGGTLEVGYQIGCGITLNVVKLDGSAGARTDLGLDFDFGTRFPLRAAVEVYPQPGQVINVQLVHKVFTGTDPRVTIKDSRIKIDGCIGESFMRSYAVLTSSTNNADDIVAYYGATKAV